MTKAAPILVACLALTACGPPGIDPQAQEQIRQRYMARLFGPDKPAEEQPEPEEAPPPAPAAPPVVPATPPAEGITVTAASLTGYWRINTYLQMSFGFGPFHKAKTDLGERADRDICELAQVKKAVKAVCLRKAYASSAGGSRDEDTLTLEWSSGPGTLIFEGQILADGSIAGGLGAGVLGVRVSDQVPASLHKLLPSAAQPGPAASEAALRLVLGDLDRSALTEARYTPAALGYIRKAKPAALGSPDELLYLGSIRQRRPEEKEEKAVDVFQIRAAGQRTLCGVSLDGELVGDFYCTASYQFS